MIWSNQKEAVTAAVGAAGNNKKLLAANPLVQDGQKIVPSITRVFRKDQTMYVYFEVYDPAMDPDRKLPSLSAQVELLTGGENRLHVAAGALVEARNQSSRRGAVRVPDPARQAVRRASIFLR